jgi:hypothetical protein
MSGTAQKYSIVAKLPTCFTKTSLVFVYHLTDDMKGCAMLRQKTIKLRGKMFTIIISPDPLPVVGGHPADAQRDDSQMVVWLAPHVSESRLPLVLQKLEEQAALEMAARFRPIPVLKRDQPEKPDSHSAYL